MGKKTDFFLRSTALLSILFFTFLIGNNWIRGSALKWSSGLHKGGDLLQHYAAGHFAKTQQWHDLYHGEHLGLWINDWLKTHNIPHATILEHFNYVYPPLLASIASLCLLLSFEVWINLFATIIVGAFFLSLVLLHRQFTSHKSTVPLLALGIPSFYFTLIPFQTSTLSLLFVCAACFLLKQNRAILAGWLLGMILFKPQFAACLAAIFTLTSQWKLVIGIMLGVSTWMIGGLLIFGIEPTQYWLSSMLHMNQGGQFIKAGMDQSWAAFIQSDSPIPSPLAKNIGLAFGLICLVMFGFKLHRFKNSAQITCAFASALYTIVTPYIGYYEILLAIPWWWLSAKDYSTSCKNQWLIGAFWLISLLTLAGSAGLPTLTPVLMTIWLMASLNFYGSNVRPIK